MLSRPPLRALALIAALFAGLVAASPGAAAQASRPAAPAAVSADLDAWLQRQISLRAIPGMQVVVVKDGQVVFAGAYGQANLQTPVPVTPDTVFSINSATKPFTGVEVLKLGERGAVDLDAPVSTYLADLPQAWRPITVRQLLTHMSGLHDVVTRDGDALGPDRTSAIAAIADRPLEWAPGDRSVYNQTNYVLLQWIIENARGRGFETVVGEDVFRPLGMSHSGFGDSLDVIPGKAASYRFRASSGDAPPRLQNVYELFPGYMRTAAGINTSALDLARWLIALQDGRILRRETLQTLWTPARFNDGRPGDWANGWVVVDRPAHRSVGMSGGGRSAFFVYPDDGVAVIVLTNLSGAYPEEMMDPIAVRFIPGLRLTGVPDLRDRLDAQGFDQADRIVDAIVARDGVAALPEGELNSWGYRLLGSGKISQALAVMKVIVRLYPASANAYDSLGEVYARAGDRTRAIENYRRSLALDPSNANAVDQLAVLEAAAPAAP